MMLALTPEPAAASSAPPSSRGHGTRDHGRERDLYEAIRHGDEAHAADIHAELLPAVEATLRRVLGSPYRNHRELARRSLEAIIVELSAHPSPERCSLQAWATTIAARVALDALCAREGGGESIGWGDASPRASDTGVRAASPGSAIDRLRWLLTELPRPQAEAILLCDVMGLAPSEIAVTLCVGTEHVRRLLLAGHERLVRQMSAES
jgi:DNA-directed RNA polymerase specialized sigma24 family protein